MKELVPFVFLERKNPIEVGDPLFTYILHVAIKYPEEKHIIKLDPFFSGNTTSDPFEFNIFSFSYKLEDGDIDNSLFDPILPNIYYESINLNSLFTEENPLKTGKKTIRNGGFTLRFLHDRFLVKLFQDDPANVGGLKIISYSLVTEFADTVEEGSGEDHEGESGGSGHPFI